MVFITFNPQVKPEFIPISSQNSGTTIGEVIPFGDNKSYPILTNVGRYDLDIAPNGTWIASAGMASVKMINLGTDGWYEGRTFSYNATKSVNGVCFSPDGKYLAYGGGRIGSTGKCYVFIQPLGKGEETFFMVEAIGVVWDVEFSPDSQYLAVTGVDYHAENPESFIKIYLTSDWSLNIECTDCCSNSSMGWSRDSQYVAVADGNDVRVLVATTGASTLLTDPSDGVGACVFSKEGKSLVVGCLDGFLYIYDSGWPFDLIQTKLLGGDGLGTPSMSFMGNYMFYTCNYSITSGGTTSIIDNKDSMSDLPYSYHLITQSINTKTSLDMKWAVIGYVWWSTYTGRIEMHEYHNVTRNVGIVETDEMTFSVPYSYSTDFVVVIPVSSGVTITSVTDNIAHSDATYVGTYSELVSGTYYYDASEQLVYIKISKAGGTEGTTISWTVTSSLGFTCSFVFPSYLNVGDYIFGQGYVKSGDVDLVTTKILYYLNATLVCPVMNQTINHNYFFVFSTTSLRPGRYTILLEMFDPVAVQYLQWGTTLYLSVDPPTDVHVSSTLSFNFYNANTGVGLLSETFKLYADNVDASEQVYGNSINTYTGDTIYYRVLDYFDNQIGSGTIGITKVHQIKDIPIELFDVAVKNMNNSIILFALNNGSLWYNITLYPGDTYHLFVKDGAYNITKIYYYAHNATWEKTENDTLVVTDDTFYIISGFTAHMFFGLYNTNDAIGLPLDTLKIYVDGNRLTGRSYDTYINKTVNITVKDYYDSIVYSVEYKLNDIYTFLDFGITFYDLAVKNLNNTIVSLSLKKNSIFYNYTLYPMDTLHILLRNGTYSINKTYLFALNGTFIKTETDSVTIPTSLIYILSGYTATLEFNFYDATSGMGLSTESFKLYADNENASTRVYSNSLDTYTGETINYRVLDYFGNKIYPIVGAYDTVAITKVHQTEDVAIQWYTFSIKNMNHSIILLNLTNGTKVLSQYLFPYEDYSWSLSPGEYNISLDYYNSWNDTFEETKMFNLTIIDTTYYWIHGYDLNDIIIEIQNGDSGLGYTILNLETVLNSLIVNVTANITAMENNITYNLTILMNSLVVIDGIVSRLTGNVTNVTLDVNLLSNAVIAHFNLLNVSLSSFWSNMNNTFVSLELNLNSSEVNITALLNGVENTLTMINNITSSLTTNTTLLSLDINALDNSVTAHFSLLNTSVSGFWASLNDTFVSLNVTLNSLQSNLNNSTTALGNIVANLTIVNSALGNFTVTLLGNMNQIETNMSHIWNTINSTWNSVNSTNGVAVFNFYNTNEGLGLDTQTLKVYVDANGTGGRLVDNLFYGAIGSTHNLTIKDYYNLTMYQSNFTIGSQYTFVDLGLTFHSYKFGNLNSDYYMISFLKNGGSRWFERGIMPFGEVEFLLPSGDYHLIIYDKDWHTVYNNGSVHMVNSRLYVINGSSLTLVINGQSIIVGQLLEINNLLQPSVVQVGYNIPFIRSIFDTDYNLDLLGNITFVCPPQIMIATTQNRTYSNRTISPLIPGNTSANGTITVPDHDRLWFQGDATSWVNISHENGTVIQNTTYTPVFYDAIGHPTLSITSERNISVLRETTFHQVKMFYWTKYTDLNKYQATINFTNVLNDPLLQVYYYVAFADDGATPDYGGITVYDVTNGAELREGENFDCSAKGIHMAVPSMSAGESRSFRITYYVAEENIQPSQAVIVLDDFGEMREHNGENYNYLYAQYVNRGSQTFIGPIEIQFNFTLPNFIAPESIDIWDDANLRYLERGQFSYNTYGISILQDAVGSVSPMGSRTYEIYYLYTSSGVIEPLSQITSLLDTPIFTLPGIGEVLGIHIIVGILMFIGIIAVMSGKSYKDHLWVFASCLLFAFLSIMAWLQPPVV
jgi:hypothetical protein